MPHDMNGMSVVVGDKMTIEVEIEEVYEGAEFCNVRTKSVVSRSDGQQECFTFQSRIGQLVVKPLLILSMLLFSCTDVSAHGGLAVVQQQVVRMRQPLFQRFSVRRQVVRQQVVAPFVVRQQIVQPYVQQVVVPQAIYAPQLFQVAPGVQAFSSGGCASAAFFSY